MSMQSHEFAALMDRLDRIERRLSSIAPASDWLTVDEAAEEFGKARSTLRRYAREGKIQQSAGFPVKYRRLDLEEQFRGLVVAS